MVNSEVKKKGHPFAKKQSIILLEVFVTSMLLRMLICNFPELDLNPSRMVFKWEEIPSTILGQSKICWYAGQSSEEAT